MSGPLAGCVQVCGFCPMGCGATLVLLADTSMLVCANVTCPRPGAAAVILADPQTEHVVEFTAQGFTIRHPLRERLDDALFDCNLTDEVAGVNYPPTLGRYQARLSAAVGWVYERLDIPPADDQAETP